jgi:hypothetical protein
LGYMLVHRSFTISVFTRPILISFNWIRLGLGTDMNEGYTEDGKKVCGKGC